MPISSAAFLSGFPQPAIDADRTSSVKFTDPVDTQAYHTRPSSVATQCSAPTSPSDGMLANFLPKSSDELHLTTHDLQGFRLPGLRFSPTPDAFSPFFLVADRTRSKPMARATSPAIDPSSSDPPPTPLITPQPPAPRSTCSFTPCRRSSSLPPFDRDQRRQSHLTSPNVPPSSPDPTSDIDAGLESGSLIPLAPPADSLFGHPAQGHLRQRLNRFTHADWACEQLAETLCHATIRYFPLGSSSVPPPHPLRRPIGHRAAPALSDVYHLAK